MEKESFSILMGIFLKVAFCLKHFFISYWTLGQWVEDKACGLGTYIHVNGARYEGEWKDDLQNGYGVETWADGSRYEGFYKNGKKNGKGFSYLIKRSTRANII